MNDIATHYVQREQYWWLCNSNYHQMVQVLMRIVQNSSLLWFDAPEWYPNGPMASKAPEGPNSDNNNKKSVDKVI